MERSPHVAVVTGANRGLGLETCRQLAELGYHVVLTSRDPAKGERAARKLAQGGLPVTHRALDVADPISVRALKQALEGERRGVDVLINNAAVVLDEDKSVVDVEPEVFPETLRTNVYGPLVLCQAFVPGMVPCSPCAALSSPLRTRRSHSSCARMWPPCAQVPPSRTSPGRS